MAEDKIDYQRFTFYINKKKEHECLHPICTYASTRYSNTNRHYNLMHLKIDKRDCCGLSFYRKFEYFIHRNNAHEDGFICDVCGLVFCKPSLLKRHVGKHSGYKPYKCQQCRYATREKFNLQRHVMNIHKSGDEKKDKSNKQMGNIENPVIQDLSVSLRSIRIVKSREMSSSSLRELKKSSSSRKITSSLQLQQKDQPILKPQILPILSSEIPPSSSPKIAMSSSVSQILAIEEKLPFKRQKVPQELLDKYPTTNELPANSLDEGSYNFFVWLAQTNQFPRRYVSQQPTKKTINNIDMMNHQSDYSRRTSYDLKPLLVLDKNAKRRKKYLKVKRKYRKK